MGTTQSILGDAFAELKRRKVFRMATTYAVIAWVILQFAEITFEPLHLPSWSLSLVVVIAIAGFPIVLVLSWAFDITSEGIVLTQETPKSTPSSRSRGLLASAMIISMVLPMAYLFYKFYLPTESGSSLMEHKLSESLSPKSVAVLPFVDLSPNGDNEYFSDGLSEELINVLNQVPELQVAARTSSFAFKGKNTDIQSIGKTLNVESVVEGSVRKSGKEIRISASLIDVRDGKQLWSESYDRKLEDIFSVQESVAEAIVSAMRVSLDEPLVNLVRATTNVEAYDYYLTARNFWRKRTPQSLQKAIELFKTAIEKDDRYALAYSGLADSYLLLSVYGNLSIEEGIVRAQPLIVKALNIDGKLAEAHASLGLLRWNLGQIESAESHLRMAISQNPNYDTAYMWLGSILGEQGRLVEQALVLQQALAIDPLHPISNINLSHNLMRQGKFEDGIQVLNDLRRVNPGQVTALASLSSWSLVYGRVYDAVKWGKKSVRFGEHVPTSHTNLARVYIFVGMLDRAEDHVNKALQLAPENGEVIATQWLLTLAKGNYQEIYNALIGDVSELIVEEAGVQQWGYELENKLVFAAYASYGLGNKKDAAHYLKLSLGDMTELAPNDSNINKISLLAALQLQNGEVIRGLALLDQADSMLALVKESGWNLPHLTYVEAGIRVMQGEIELGMGLLHQSISEGWRGASIMKLDPRLVQVSNLPGFEKEVQRINDALDAVKIRLSDVVVTSL